MSIAINPDSVTAVLLADGWHDLDPSTFTLDAYEFFDGDLLLHGGGRNGICATGFTFRQGDDWVSGPLTSVVAVRHAEFSPRTYDVLDSIA